jgi:hypothetical protein
MTASTFTIIGIRLLVPLSILRWPFIGAVLSIAADALDIVIATLMDRYLHGGDVWRYHELDKYLDTYYLAVEAIVVQRWPLLPRWVGTGLFSYRLIGVILFEITDVRLLLFIFPAIFDFYFLFYAGVTQYLPDYEVTPRRLFFWLAVLTVPKMFQEYTIHYARWLDNIVAVDVITNASHHIIDWFRDRFRPITGWLLAPG